ncbi:hypothetical protein Ocin01_17283 [Orchesella cincta]|uniref:Uncharacterized protein n=1 Tax=Orchesella cincta TaxID=48709 RepID=A0A1D2M8U3_ORCCI|nr:hypothetical protein Ocin01_17283 [Orchesella cincta]
MKAVVLDKFATVGLPDFDTPLWGRNWSIVALSQQLIDEKLLRNVQNQSNIRSLDLVVIGNENRIALLNLQAFKLFPSHLATSMIRQSLAHHFTEDGSLLFGIQTSGDLFVITDHLKTVKHIRRPYFVKLNHSSQPWYSRVSRTLSNMVGFLAETNQVVPEEVNSQRIMISNWLASSQKFNGIFPVLTATPDGFAIFCALSPQDCFIFLTSYETALRQRSIGNFKGSSVPGRWHRILMDRFFIRRWLEEKEQLWFEARVCSLMDEDDKEVIGGGMLYAVLENSEFHLVYGTISKLNSYFRVSWEVIQYELDWPLPGESKDAFNLGSRFVARLSSDCGKIAVVINTHVGAWVRVEHLPTPVYEEPVKLKRHKVSFCPHGDYDGTYFFKRECWVSDIQWLAEDGYFAVMTQCGCLSIFHSSGNPMIIKTTLTAVENPDVAKMTGGRFYLPVFHRHQISTRSRRGQPPYPTLKWVDSQQVLSCSSGLKIELFSLKRVFNLGDDEDNDDEKMGQFATYPEPLILHDSLTLLYAQGESQVSGLSETDKESLPDDDYASVSPFPSSPRTGGKTEGERQFQHRHNSILKSITKPKDTPAPPTSANENEVVVSPVFVYKNHRTPVEYVSVEDDEYDIYGDCTTTSSGEAEEEVEENDNDSIDKDVLSTVEKLVESCDEEEVEGEDEESTRPFSQSVEYNDSTLNNNDGMVESNATISAASVESAPSIENECFSSAVEIPRGCLSLPDLDTSFALRKKSRIYISPQPPSTATTTTTIPTVETYSPPFTALPTSTDDDDALQNARVLEEATKLKIPAVPSIMGVVMSPQRQHESVETFVQTEPVKILELTTALVTEKVARPQTTIAIMSTDDEKSESEVTVNDTSSAAEQEEEESEVEIQQVVVQMSEQKPKVEDEEPENNNNVAQDQYDYMKPNHDEREPKDIKQNKMETKDITDTDSTFQSTVVACSETQTLVSSLDDHGTQTMRFEGKSGNESKDTSTTLQRCRPFCIVTAPPPPTCISSTGLSQSSRLTLQSEHLIFNKAANDQMSYKSILVPDATRKRKKKRRKKVTLMEETGTLQVTAEKEEEAKNDNQVVGRNISLTKLSEQAVKKLAEESTDDDSAPSRSQQIWEQAAKQFQQKVNRLVEHKRGLRASSLDFIEREVVETAVKMLGSLPNIVEKVSSKIQDKHDDNDLGGEEVKEIRSEPNAQERLQSILIPGGPARQKLSNRLLWLRSSEPTVVEQFKGRTLPYDASSSSDMELVEELKRRLQLLKYQQEQCKISGNRELTKFMSSWALASESVLPDLQDMKIQPIVFPLATEASPEIKPESNHQSPLSPPPLQEQIVKESLQMSKSQPTFIFSGPPAVKRNKSHQVVNKFSMNLPQSFQPPVFMVPPQTPRKTLYKPKPMYIAPFIPFPLAKFTVGPSPKMGKRSERKAKFSSTPAGKSKDLIPSRSSHLFVKARPGTTKITKTSPIHTFPLTHGVNSTTSAIINSAQFQTLLTRKSGKRTGCTACKTCNVTDNKSQSRDKRGVNGSAAAAALKSFSTAFRDNKAATTPKAIDKLAELRGKLPVTPEQVEKVPLVGTRSSITGGASSRGKGPYDLLESERVARRVSFSDPIAIVKTLSPLDLKEKADQQGARDPSQNDSSAIDWTWQ